jgi:hypothetical protein
MNNFWTGVCVGILIGAFALFGGVMVASGQTAQTTVTVVIEDEISSADVTASVACNEVNCPDEEEVEVGFWAGVISWFKSLI